MLFIDNKYTRWYNSIISQASRRNTHGYTEKHHIIPKSLEGSNHNSNLVKLTAREHFICHRLLTKMTEGRAKSKMHLALLKMCVTSLTHKDNRIHISGSKYEKIRIEAGKANSGINSPTYGRKKSEDEKRRTLETYRKNQSTRTTYKHSDEVKDKISKANKGRSRPDMVELMKLNNKKINHNTNTGKHWYNDGIKSYLLKECPEGCVPGRLLIISRHNNK